jgi:hypothetical protein
MTRDDLIRTVLGRLGNRQNDVALQAVAVDEWQLVQSVKLEGADFKPWFLLSALEETTLVAGDERLSLPTRFLMEYDEGALFWRPTPADTWLPIPKFDLDYASARNPGLGHPQSYSIVGNKFIISPTPDLAYEVAMRYYKSEPAISGTYLQPDAVVTSNQWTTLGADWALNELGVVLAGFHTRDQEAASGFLAQAQAAKQRLLTETIARQEANADRQMGEN